MAEYLSRDAILAANDRPTEDVDVPEWGGTVRVRALSGTQRSQYLNALLKMSADGKERQIVLENAEVRLAALSIVDAENRAMFSLADIAALGSKSAAALNRVTEVAQRLSAIRPEDVDEAVVDLEPTPSGDSTTASPES